MEIEALAAFGVVLLLLAAASIARRRAVAGRARDALSIVLVALGLIAAFLLFFEAGTLVRKTRTQPALHSQATAPHAVRADRIAAADGQNATSP